MTLPEYQTMCGCADVLMHTMERYFGREAPMELTICMAEALMRSVMENARVLLAAPDDYEARAQVMWAGSLSHNGLTGCRGRRGRLGHHKLEHELGGLFDVAHGAGLTALWGSWARYVYREQPARFARFAEKVLGWRRRKARRPRPWRALRRWRPLPRHSHAHYAGRTGRAATDAQIEEMAESSVTARGAGKFRPLGKADMAAIYRAAR